MLVFEFEALPLIVTDLNGDRDCCAETESFEDVVNDAVLLIVPVGVRVGWGFCVTVIVALLVNVAATTLCDAVTDAVPVFEDVIVRVFVALDVIVNVLILVPLTVGDILGVFVNFTDKLNVGLAEDVLEARIDVVLFAVLVVVLLCIGHDVLVLEVVIVEVLVPETDEVFVDVVVREPDGDPVEVFETDTLPVVVTVFLIVAVLRGDALVEGDAELVLEACIERVPVGDAEEVFEAGAERLYDGVALDVLVEEIDAVFVFDTNPDFEIAALDVVVLVAADVTDGSGELVIDLLVVADRVDVFENPAVNVVVDDGVSRFVGRDDCVRPDVRVDVFDDVGLSVGTTAPSTRRRGCFSVCPFSETLCNGL